MERADVLVPEFGRYILLAIGENQIKIFTVIIMQTNTAQTIFDKVKTLSQDQQEEVLKFIEAKLSVSEKRESRPIWEIAREISESVPIEEWEKMPSDGSVNVDHYLYGAPKKY